ncbi:unnamed protein product [Acanthoscelides obtectus]|uniref:Uncharacterized protein n=1 Tax=Acanthoscelides obtectus TaxID=200917 RepID=A0A9P0JM37_ACAOB|nr:unnamed protein product [Acanthoscelides obtectus]CAK1634723.1 hypothetical protein AOBTE_LOCUS8869 [Acanthoscelides obtectus]
MKFEFASKLSVYATDFLYFSTSFYLNSLYRTIGGSDLRKTDTGAGWEHGMSRGCRSVMVSQKRVYKSRIRVFPSLPKNIEQIVPAVHPALVRDYYGKTDFD